MSRNFEDKKCRLCGLANSENENIFATRDRHLVKKIAAVYSIWVTPEDPLPKCICRKCHEKLIAAFKNCKQVKQLQMKWHENVMSNDANNNYIKILQFIERANISIKNFIETNYGEQICKDAIENLLIGALSDADESIASSVLNDSNDETMNSTEAAFRNGSQKEEADDEDDQDEEENLALAKIANGIKAKSSSPSSLIVKCKYCVLKFETLKELAMHQVSHMKLSMPKLFEPKCLDKHFRRGRLISVQSRQSIRCLNCYLIFDDNKCILEHWSRAECDFFCPICSEEFAYSPKLLREHIYEEHGISYRSLKMQRDLLHFNAPSTSSKPPSSKPKQQQRHKVKSKKPTFLRPIPTDISTSSSMAALRASQRPTIKCRICKRDFRNFKACNSHMRAHKPPYAYDDNEPLTDLGTDAYMEPEPPAENQTSNIILPVDTAQTNDSIKPLTTASKQNSVDNELGKPLIKNESNFDAIDMDLEPKIEPKTANFEPPTNQSSSSSSNNLNNISTNIAKPPAISPQQLAAVSKAPTTATTTAPRGIRMKFVNRRSDLNGNNYSAIKVNSSNMPNVKPNVGTNYAVVQIQPPSFNNVKPMPNAMPQCASTLTLAQQHIPLNDVKPLAALPAVHSQIPAMPAAAPLPYANFTTIPSPLACTMPATPPNSFTPPHHTSVIVHSLSTQSYASPYCSLPTPYVYENALLSNCNVKDEPMEFI